MKKKLFILFVFISFQTYSQVLEFGEPIILPSAINTESDEAAPLLSPDGKMLFFSRLLYSENTGGKYSGHDIWVSDFFDPSWKKATNRISRLNNKRNNVVIGIGSLGDVLYLMDANPAKQVKGIYFSRKKGNDWSQPELIPVKGIENSGFLTFFMSPDFDILFISMKGSDTRGEEDLYISLKDTSGTWSKPKNLGPTINTKGFEISPFLSKDKNRLYFSSNGHPGMGDADIFVSERLYGSWEAWSVPQNLVNAVNSEKFDAYFAVYGDSVCFLSSNRNSDNANLFSAKVRINNGEKDREKIAGIMNDTKELLNELRSSSQSLINTASLKSIIIYEDNTSMVSHESKGVLGSILQTLSKNPEKKLKIMYDGKVIDSSKSASLINKERIRLLKQELKRYGIIESRIVISSDLFSSESMRVRLNSLALIPD